MTSNLIVFHSTCKRFQPINVLRVEPSELSLVVQKLEKEVRVLGLKNNNKKNELQVIVIS